jgi:hypothetical protein
LPRLRVVGSCIRSGSTCARRVPEPAAPTCLGWCAPARRTSHVATQSYSVGFWDWDDDSRRHARFRITRLLPAKASPCTHGAALNSRSCRRPSASCDWESLTEHAPDLTLSVVRRRCGQASNPARNLNPRSPRGEHGEELPLSGGPEPFTKRTGDARLAHDPERLPLAQPPPRRWRRPHALN